MLDCAGVVNINSASCTLELVNIHNEVMVTHDKDNWPPRQKKKVVSRDNKVVPQFMINLGVVLLKVFDS